MTNTNNIALCGPADTETICEIINESAMAYKGVIPADCWHEPYMPLPELRSEITKGVRFYGFKIDGQLVGVMGIQDVKDVTLIRHAYIRTKQRSQGIGRQLLEFVTSLTSKPILIGAWAAASWAVRFYQNNGFTLVDEVEKEVLLRTYWTISTRQLETSVVVVDQRWMNGAAREQMLASAK